MLRVVTSTNVLTNFSTELYCYVCLTQSFKLIDVTRQLIDNMDDKNKPVYTNIEVQLLVCYKFESMYY